MIQISIVIATWNAAEALERCLNSIISQLNDECELIIVDGGSTDSTNSIISKYLYSISYTVSEKDSGIYDAWNKGIKVANGQWIMFVGADDLLLDNAIRNYLHIIHNTKDIDSYDYICALNEYVDEKGNILKVIGGDPKWNIYRKRMNAAHVASLHNKRSLFESIGLYDLQFKICADYELLLRKRDNLRPLFIKKKMARMKSGGMSFSTKAIIETYRARKKNHTVPLFINVFLLIRDWFAFRFFMLRKIL